MGWVLKAQVHFRASENMKKHKLKLRECVSRALFRSNSINVEK